jgi:eukaryotic translation initiation factor 2C
MSLTPVCHENIAVFLIDIHKCLLGPGSVKYTPSIAAVVASVDQDFGQFPASLSLQKSKQEVSHQTTSRLCLPLKTYRLILKMIEKLDKLMHERFEDYRSVNAGKLPERIVIYRDGVSEGQFDTVLEQELPLIHKSFEKYNEPNAPYKPTVTIVVCGKVE